MFRAGTQTAAPRKGSRLAWVAACIAKQRLLTRPKEKDPLQSLGVRGVPGAGRGEEGSPEGGLGGTGAGSPPTAPLAQAERRET